MSQRAWGLDPVLERVVAAARAWTVPDGAQRGKVPLHDLGDDSDDFLWALLDAWSACVENLAFTRDRIADEGFLRTATETRSLLELLHQMGSSVGLPRSAGVWVHVKVSDHRPQPPVRVPPGMPIRSVPTAKTPSCLFEIRESFVAHSTWNCAQVASATTEPTGPRLLDGARGMFVAGSSFARPGMKLVLSGETPHGPWAERVLLQRCAHLPARGLTALLWEHPLSLPGGVSEVRAWPVRGAARLLGSDATPFHKLPLQDRLRYSPPAGGLQHWSQGRWTALADRTHAPPDAEITLPPLIPARAAVATAGGALLIATPKHLVRREPSGDWTDIKHAFPQGTPISLGTAPDGEVFAGTARGSAFTSTDGGKSWRRLSGSLKPHQEPTLRMKLVDTRLPRTPIHAIAGARLPADKPTALTYVLAATGYGVFSWDGAGWTSIVTGLEDPFSIGGGSVSTHQLAFGKSLVGVATNQGLFLSTPIQSRDKWVWKPTGENAIDGVPIVHIAATALGEWCVVTASGLWCSEDDGTSWTPVAVPGHRASVSALLLQPNPSGGQSMLWVATSAGVFNSVNMGRNWLPAQTGLTPNTVELLVAGPGRSVFADTPLHGTQNTTWPGFALTSPLRVRTSQDTVSVAPWVLLERGAGGAHALTRVRHIQEAHMVAFGRSAEGCEVELEPGVSLTPFDRRTCRLGLLGTELRVSDTCMIDVTPLQGTDLRRALLRKDVFHRVTDPAHEVVWLTDELDLKGTLPSPEGRWVFVQGRCRRVCFEAAPPASVKTPARQSRPIRAGETGTALSIPTQDGAGGVVFRVRMVDGATGEVRCDSTTLRWLGALGDAPVETERRRVEAFSLSHETTRIALDESLGLPFDPLSVSVLGNVGYATHGQTSEREIGVIQPDQLRFKLHGGMLTILASAPETFDGLQIQVGDISWRPISHLALAGPRDEVYEVVVDGTTVWVQFGDGRFGALPPAGAKVKGRWRTGAGAAGNVPSDALRILLEPPRGLVSVHNPQPASGGADAPPLTEQVRRLPHRLRPAERCVSLGDLEDRVAALPEVAQSHAASTVGRGMRHTVITVVTHDVAAEHQIVPKGTLEAAIHGLAGQLPFDAGAHVVGFTAVPIRLVACLVVASDRDPAMVVRQARVHMLHQLSVTMRGLGQALAASDVTRMLLQAPGVLNSRLLHLAPLGESSTRVCTVINAPGPVVKETTVVGSTVVYLEAPEFLRILTEAP